MSRPSKTLYYSVNVMSFIAGILFMVLSFVIWNYEQSLPLPPCLPQGSPIGCGPTGPCYTSYICIPATTWVNSVGWVFVIIPLIVGVAFMILAMVRRK